MKSALRERDSTHFLALKSKIASLSVLHWCNLLSSISENFKRFHFQLTSSDVDVEEKFFLHICGKKRLSWELRLKTKNQYSCRRGAKKKTKEMKDFSWSLVALTKLGRFDSTFGGNLLSDLVRWGFRKEKRVEKLRLSLKIPQEVLRKKGQTCLSDMARRGFVKGKT